MSGARQEGRGIARWIARRCVARASALVLALLAAGPAQAQRRGRTPPPPPPVEAVPYDGRFTWARLRYGAADFSGFRREAPWSHDYPRGERNFTRILQELTVMRVRTQESQVLALDDPRLAHYPVAYMSEAGYWRPTDAEVAGLQRYVAKGGFLVFDDFAGDAWGNFEAQMRRAFPAVRPVRLTAAHPVFDSFYRIPSIDMAHPYYGLPSVFYGFFADNDPAGRMFAIANYNNDLSEFWEFADRGFFAVDETSTSYKFGINYVIYALSR